MPSTTTRRLSASLLAGALSIGGLAACSSDKKAESSPSTTAPEAGVSTDAEVATGLTELAAAAKEVAIAGSDKAGAKTAIARLEPIWSRIEGTVKTNDKDAYAQIEEDLALLDRGAEGDASSTQKGSDDMASTVTAYLTKHPG